ncbi:MAG: hypothetical protein JXR76_13145 [Deltaproteobacteria bacterium]|nr:hypothetical protein [Deltaproteobacteria bacterium]
MNQQVELLQDLLARVQRNRARMSGIAQSERTLAFKVTDAPIEPESTIELSPRKAVAPQVDGGEEIIDLVHPTSIPPAVAEVKPEDDFSSVVPQTEKFATTGSLDKRDLAEALPPSMAPAPAASHVDKLEDDFSSVAPVSIAPPAATGSSYSSEDDFSSVAPVSVVPSAPHVVESTGFNKTMDAPAETRLAGEPAEKTDGTLELVSISAAPVTKPRDEDELEEIVNTDTASKYPAMPAEMEYRTSESAGHEDKTVVARVSFLSTEPPEQRTFQKTARASDDVVVVTDKSSTAKLWTVDAVLQRALGFAKKS